MGSDNEMKITYIALSDIFVDSDFNCRGEIVPFDVIELSKSIESIGLQQPVVVQPVPHDLKGHCNNKAFRLVAGHRRLKAFEVLKRDTIPAIVKTNLTDVQARVLNLQENLERKNLNILQEAQAINKFKLAGYTVNEVAKMVGMSTGWVQIRYSLLNLEPEIQNVAAAGLLTQEQVKDIHALPTQAARFEAVKAIKESRIRGEKKALKVKKPKRNIHSKKPKSREEIFEIQEHIIDTFGASLATRCLAWAAGEISTLDLINDLREYAKEQEILYTPPEFENAAV